jgi:hypothetical protein
MRLPLLLLVALLARVPAAAAADFTVFSIGSIAYSVNGNSNPDLPLVRGLTYTFAIDAPGHPFWIKTAQVIGTASAFNTGVTNNGTQSGTLTFTVPQNAPDTLFYICQFHSPMTGALLITDLAVESSTWSGIKALYSK